MRKGMTVTLVGLMGMLVVAYIVAGCAQAANASAPASRSAQTSKPAPTFRVAATPTPAFKPITLKLANPVSETHHVSQINLQPLAKVIAEKTQGRVKIEIYYSETLSKAVQSYEAVRTGGADMAFLVPGNTPGQFPMTSIASLPYAFSRAVTGAKSLLALYKAGYLDKEYSEVHVVSFGSSSPNQIHLTSKRPTTLADFQGLKVRSSGGYVSRALQAAGMIPVNMAAADLYLAMQRGVIDATVLAYASAPDYKLAEIVHNVCELSLGATPLAVVMNKGVWERLPKDIQKVFDDLQEEATFRGGNSYDSTDEIGRKMYTDARVNMYKPPSAEMTKLLEQGKVVWTNWVAEMEGKRLPGQKAYAEFLSILQKLGERPPYTN